MPQLDISKALCGLISHTPRRRVPGSPRAAKVVRLHVSLTQHDCDRLPKKEDDVVYYAVWGPRVIADPGNGPATALLGWRLRAFRAGGFVHPQVLRYELV